MSFAVLLVHIIEPPSRAHVTSAHAVPNMILGEATTVTATRPGIRGRHETPKETKESRTWSDGLGRRQNAVIREAINKNGGSDDGAVQEHHAAMFQLTAVGVGRAVLG
jgi:hypothetical protein